MKKIINRTNGKILGSIIKMNRHHQNMSQKALSDGICVSSYLSRIENAEIIPSEQVISELFEALAIHYNDSEDFLRQGQQLLTHFLEELMFNEFSNSKQIFEEIEKQSEAYRHSPLIIDYYIVCLAFYCTNKDRHVFEATRSLLESVESLMSADQRFKYYLYYGIDHAKVYRDYNGAYELLVKAHQFDTNGHLFYWLGYVHLELGSYIKAFEMFTRALELYVSEANLLSIIGTYEMLGLTHFRANNYEDGISYLKKGLKLSQKLQSSQYEIAFKSNIKWGMFKLGDFDFASSNITVAEIGVLNEFTIPVIMTSFFANLEMENSMSVSELLPFFKKEDSPHYEPFVDLLEHPEPILWSEKIIENELILKMMFDRYEKLNYELAKHLKSMLIRLYKNKRRYKEALELTNMP
ncbi:helix-turn-helix transcriptional regulator [Fusibacter bizertensis]|uniref:Helix-turn-helix transcriptional regulator n=1 Tax=Fusibacter bizertensis TaxID=1488331 RepID=A0ABT6NC89_9FIRM|nr:helix-turn-helix transcriptional regulator [Fusibacter bizertensis]MDH8678031.1 helix-turn-helix transcriptional regulator [Fusibacter bizertensis]